MNQFFWLKTKIYSYKKIAIKNKKTKNIKECTTKRKVKLKDYKNCLKLSKFWNEINLLGKENYDVDEIKRCQ